MAGYLSSMPPRSGDGELRAVIESPQGSRNKLSYSAELRTFEMGSSLPAGMTFPFDFGFIPGTQAEDGDPLDVLVLMDAAAYPGVIVPIRLLGVIEAEQRDGDGKPYRNDRRICIAVESTERGEVRRLAALEPHLIEQIQSFFVTYAGLSGKEFKALRIRGPTPARRRVDRLSKVA